MSKNALRVLGICGSLRQESYNRLLLQAAAASAPKNITLEIFDNMQDIPLFNEDVEKKGDPESIKFFKRKINEADAILFATPEYNYSIPGVLKNAIDWASRPGEKSALDKKPCGIIGATPGSGGTARSQIALRQALIFTANPIFMKPELLISKVHEKTGKNGKHFDDKTTERLTEYLQEFSKWISNQMKGFF